MAKRAAQGTGSIRKKTVTRSGSEYTYWEARLFVGRDPGTGKPKYKSFTGKTQKEVRQKLQAAAVAVNEGSYLEPSRLTLGQWADIWLREYTADKKYLTVKGYRAQIEAHIKPALGSVRLSELTPPLIQSFYNELGRTGHEIKKKDDSGKLTVERVPLSPKSIKNVHNILTKLLNTAIEVDYIKTNPAQRTTLPKREKKEISPLTDEQIKALVRLLDADTSDYSPLLKLILFTGLREGEALGLTWDCVDFEKGSLRVYQQLQKRPKADGGYTFAPLKNSKPRVLALAPYVLDLLRSTRARQIQQRMKAGELWQGWQNMKAMTAGLIFSNAVGGCLNPKAVYLHYKKLAALIGAPESRVHDLRHTFAVLSLQNGDDVKTVQDNLGHATAAFTLDVYGHVSETMKNQSAARLQSYISALS